MPRLDRFFRINSTRRINSIEQAPDSGHRDIERVFRPQRRRLAGCGPMHNWTDRKIPIRAIAPIVQGGVPFQEPFNSLKQTPENASLHA